MFKRISTFTAMGAAVLFAAPFANAGTYNFSFESDPGQIGYEISGQLVASNTAGLGGGYSVLSMTGTIEYYGATISHYTSNIVYTPGGGANATGVYDNLIFFPAAPGYNLDSLGLGFLDDHNPVYAYRIFGSHDLPLAVDPMNSSLFPTIDIIGTFTLTAATPVPAALPMFATGLVGLGWLARRRRKQAA